MRIYRILILEIITAVFIFCSLTTIKYVFPSAFNFVTEFYVTNFCVETDINLVIGE